MIKRFISILFLLILLLATFTPTSVSQVSIEVKDTEGSVVEEQETKDILTKAGLDPNTTILERDYGEKVPDGIDGVDNALACSRTYLDTKTGQSVLVVGNLPYVDAYGNSILPAWIDRGSYYLAEQNTFVGVVQNDLVSLVVENDQADTKDGDTLQFNAQLFMGGEEILPKDTEPTLLGTDPYNENYQNNVLVWDYGICKRYLRLIEGRMLGFWEFTEVPDDYLTIIYNQSGPYRLHLGSFAVSDDIEFITVADFEELLREKEIVYISDSATFYPDAGSGNTTVDGMVRRYVPPGGKGWADIHDGAGTHALDSTNAYGAVFAGDASGIYTIYRMIYTFDTSSLPDDCTISSTTLSFHGIPGAVYDTWTWKFSINIYSSNPASNNALILADYDKNDFGTTPFCDTAMVYADYNTTGYYDFELNANGMAAISKTGITKLAERIVNDATDTDPGGNQNGTAGCEHWLSDKGEGYKPKLVVVYSDGPPPEPTIPPGKSNSLISPSSGPGGMFF